jgi:hypothetical protein
MTMKLEKVFEQIRQLPDEEQDRWADELLEDLRDARLIRERQAEIDHALRAVPAVIAQAEATRARLDADPDQLLEEA